MLKGEAWSPGFCHGVARERNHEHGIAGVAESDVWT